MFQTSVSDILLLKPFMSNFGPAPSRITRKISPSVEPRSHVSSVRFDGCVPSGAIGPLPCASAPWQKRQFFWNSACPALIDSGDEATGFLSFLPSGLPPGFCAADADANRTASAKAEMDARTVVTRRMLTGLLCLVACHWQIARCRFYAKGGPACSTHAGAERLPDAKGRFGKSRTSTGDDDRHFLVGDQRAIVGAAAEHVGAWLAEAHLDGLFAVGRNGGPGPPPRPPGGRARAGGLPRPGPRRGGRNPPPAPLAASG